VRLTSYLIGRAEPRLLTNPTFLWGYVHVILASLVTASLVMLAVSAWYLRKQREVSAFHPTQIIAIPRLLSILATGTWGGAVEGLNELQKQYGPGNYIPDVFIQYWSMRVMAYLGSLIALLALWGGWLLHRGTLDRSKWFLRACLWAAVTPFLMNTAGWLLTESGRQPWIVQGLMKTVNANSPSVSTTDIWISLIVFVGIYIALGAADVVLLLRYSKRGLEHEDITRGETGDPSSGAGAMPALTY
jgi:cytochrome bd ubiquinol oxidase subunit I